MTSYLDTLRQAGVPLGEANFGGDPRNIMRVCDSLMSDVWDQLVAVAEAAERLCFCGDEHAGQKERLKQARAALQAAVEAHEKGQP